MPAVKCPFPKCEFITEDLADVTCAQVLSIHALVHTNVPRQQSDRIEKVRRPSIKMGCNSEDWDFSSSKWTTYKKFSKISGAEIVAQLLECCDDALQMDLYRNHGRLEDKDEAFVMSKIKQHAVIAENTVLARVNHLQMRQDLDETARNYAA